ncbi:protein RER1A [Rosa chinensis]|uniref:protein RER1A n=1 Tax=Rosa chinensis TaxID=74649 RepID=UPI001AD941F5|nr:protein RER1A [Rosa chinensis]
MSETNDRGNLKIDDKLPWFVENRESLRFKSPPLRLNPEKKRNQPTDTPRATNPKRAPQWTRERREWVSPRRRRRRRTRRLRGSPLDAVQAWSFGVSHRYQHLLYKTTPHVLHRWLATLGVALVYVLRVYFVQGFYIMSYGLGIYLLNLLIGFLSPQVDPEIHDLFDGPSLPTRGFDEFRPFVRRLPEFKFCFRDDLNLGKKKPKKKKKKK